LKRVVVSLLQNIDSVQGETVILAATNHEHLLDPAIWRRFELHIEFPLPDQDAIHSFIEGRLGPYFPATKAWSDLLAIAFAGRSFSDIERDLSTARRGAALGDAPLEEHLAGLLTNKSLPKKRRIHLAAAIVNQGLLSQRKARELTGVARDTIRVRARKRVPARSRKRDSS